MFPRNKFFSYLLLKKIPNFQNLRWAFMTILTMPCLPRVSKCKVPLVCCCCCPLESWWRVSGAGTWPGTSPSCGWSGPSCCDCASHSDLQTLRGGACRSPLPENEADEISIQSVLSCQRRSGPGLVFYCLLPAVKHWTSTCEIRFCL